MSYSKWWNGMEFTKRYKLPYLPGLLEDKKKSPYVKFYEHIARKMNVKVSDVQVVDIYVTSDIEYAINILEEIWHKKHDKFRSIKILEKAMGPHRLAYGPASFHDQQPEWANNNYLYIRKSE